MVLKKLFKGTEKMWNIFLKPGLKTAICNFSASVAAKTKNPKSARTTSVFLKSSKGGRILNLTDMHGNGLKLRVMWFHFK